MMELATKLQVGELGQASVLGSLCGTALLYFLSPIWRPLLHGLESLMDGASLCASFHHSVRLASLYLSEEQI